MSSYVVLARKWRSSQFSDIVGQHHVVRTLMNAIHSQRIHQAYLMTGSRGIGKTSIARIFAKAVRCQNVRWVELTQPIPEKWLQTCDTCSSCVEIATNRCVDVVEIDGASNNGVDAVREIRENAKYLPATGNKKIYIIDEVHMLTTAAFNALLKTLEEPPPHVIFIFATTEPHKIPATILSRCQRFDLKRHTIAQIQGRLTQIAAAEKIQAEAGALALLARAAEGSMRDSLSLLDQVIAYAGEHVTTQATREAIGLIEGPTLIRILRAIFARNATEALALANSAYEQGHDLRILMRSLVEFLYGAILTKINAGRAPGLELSDDEWAELKGISELRALEEMELIFQALNHGAEWIARSPQPKIVLDVILIKCALAQALISVGAGGARSAVPTEQRSSSPTPVPPRKPTPEFQSAPVVAPAQTAPHQTTLAQTEAVQTTTAPPHSWEAFIERVRPKRPLLATFLEHGAGSIENTTLTIAFAPTATTFRDQLQNRVYSEQLQTLAREYFGATTFVRIENRDSGESVAGRKERERSLREEAARSAAQNHPMIAEARALFGGELGPIELIEPSEGATHAGA